MMKFQLYESRNFALNPGNESICQLSFPEMFSLNALNSVTNNIIF